MGNYVGYSPWQDAANYGQGLGQALGAILLQQPRLRAQQQEEVQRFPLEQQLLQAQVRNAQMQPDLKEQQLQFLGQRLQAALAGQAETTKLKDAQIGNYKSEADLRKAEAEHANAEAEKSRNPVTKPQSDSTQFSEGTRGLGLLSQSAKAQAGEAGMAPTVPIHIDPKLKELVANLATRPGGLGQVLDALSQIKGQPNLSTNAATGWFSKPTVTTNSFDVNMPAGLEQLVAATSGGGSGSVTNSPAATPTQPQMIRVKSATGQTGRIPADQLQQALQEGYQVIQ